MTVEQVSESAVYRPPPALLPFVERYVGYRYLGYEAGVHVGMPGRYLTVVISFDDPLTLAMQPDGGSATDHIAMVSGFHDRAVEIRHNGNQHGIQLDVTPAGARALFGAPAQALVSTAVDLADTWSESTAAELYERTATATAWADRFAVLDDLLLRALSARLPYPSSARVAATDAWRMLTASGGTARVADVATELGWSRRYLTEQFTAEYGLPPKTMAGLLRLERTVSMLKRPGNARLGEVAAACGYADQAHMNRDWQRIVGRSPTAWLAAEQLPFVQDDDHPDGAG